MIATFPSHAAQIRARHARRDPAVQARRQAAARRCYMRQSDQQSWASLIADWNIRQDGTSSKDLLIVSSFSHYPHIYHEWADGTTYITIQTARERITLSRQERQNYKLYGLRYTDVPRALSSPIMATVTVDPKQPYTFLRVAVIETT